MNVTHTYIYVMLYQPQIVCFFIIRLIMCRNYMLVSLRSEMYHNNYGNLGTFLCKDRSVKNNNSYMYI